MDRTPGIRPRPTLWRRLDAAARHCFPATATVVGMILSAAPFGLPGQAQILPAWVLACVFFWSLFRPAAMSPPVVFLIGVLADLLGQMPLGVSVVVLLAAHGLALRVRRVLPRQGFLVVWLVFVAVAAGASALEWVLLSALSLRVDGRAVSDTGGGVHPRPSRAGRTGAGMNGRGAVPGG